MDCIEFQRLGRYIGRWLRRQPAVGEESLTDWLLYQMSQRIRWVTYYKFKRYEESRESGADWDWWFLSNQTSFGARVQAKKLTAGADHYRGIAHTNRSGLQIEMLIESAKFHQLVPLYNFYHVQAGKPSVRCAGNSRAGTDEGVFVASAYEVYERFIKPGRATVLADPVMSLSNPLSCFVCCPFAQEADNAGGIWRFLSHYHPPEGAVLGDDAPADAPPRRQPPAHILSLLKFGAENVPEWFENEFESQMSGTKALLVFDLRRQIEGSS